MTNGINRAVRSHQGAGEHIRLLLNICQREQLSIPQTAYLLATVHHESKMGLWMLDHASGWAYEGRYHLGNIESGDGPRFRGRGYIRIVGRRQYTAWEKHLRLPLTAEPDLVTKPSIAAEIAVQGMKWGRFTGERLADFVNDGGTDYVGARRVINGNDRAGSVASKARRYEAALREVAPTGPPVASVKMVQRQLRTIGWPLVVDGILGTFTRRALRDFQRGYTFDELEPTGQPDGTTTRSLARCVAGGGHVSDNFRFTEFRTGGSHRLSINNRVVCVRRDLVSALEAYRTLAGGAVRIASGYRSVGHNHRIGGSPDCKHLCGRAVDLWFPRLPAALVVDLGAFTAIGTRRGVAVHLEVSPTGSTTKPHVWVMD
ncbi:MAG: hypothetical protein GY773_30490 [Actinomycetia bacterium]|nr:hypothetical protein [Actinomycetes bacterium]